MYQIGQEFIFFAEDFQEIYGEGYGKGQISNLKNGDGGSVKQIFFLDQHYTQSKSGKGMCVFFESSMLALEEAYPVNRKGKKNEGQWEKYKKKHFPPKNA